MKIADGVAYQNQNTESLWKDYAVRLSKIQKRRKKHIKDPFQRAGCILKNEKKKEEKTSGSGISLVAKPKNENDIEKILGWLRSC